MKLLFTPPLRTDAKQWKARLDDLKLGYNIVLAENDEAVKAELPDTDAVFGWVSPDCLPFAKRLRWLQSPQAGPTRGFYYDELVAHPVVVCNPRGVYNDHIAQHIMMYVLALSRGLPAYLEAQRHSRWERDAPSTRYVDLSQASALIVGVGGIGQETSLRCQAFGMTVHGIDGRWEYETPGLLRHNAGELREVAAEVEALFTAADSMKWIGGGGLPERMRFAFLTASPWRWQLVAPYPNNPGGFVDVTSGKTHPVAW